RSGFIVEAGTKVEAAPFSLRRPLDGLERSRGQMGGLAQVESPIRRAGRRVQAAHAAGAAHYVEPQGILATRTAGQGRGGHHGAVELLFPDELAVGASQTIAVAVARAEINVFAVRYRSFEDAVVHGIAPQLLAGAGMDAQECSRRLAFFLVFILKDI